MDPSPALTTTVVFRNGESGYPFFRIPALLRINSTLILAFAEGRRQRTDHGSVDLVLKRSTNDGASWSKEVSLVASSSSRHTSRATFGNPAPLYDPVAGVAVLFFCVDNKEIQQTRSVDGGVSWSIPTAISWSRPESWAWVATGPPAALRTVGGRWVLPCDGLVGSAQVWKATSLFSFTLLSDDHGMTWRQSNLLDGGNECQAAELRNGSLVLNMRSIRARRLHATSHDAGETWSAPLAASPPVPDANCQGSMISVDAPATAEEEEEVNVDGRASDDGTRSGGRGSDEAAAPPTLLVATSAGMGRRGLTARTSHDGGARWSTLAVLEEGDAAYSALADLGGGWVGCLYETKRPRGATTNGAAGAGGAAAARNGAGLKAMMDDVIAYVRFDAAARAPWQADPPRAANRAATPRMGGARGGGWQSAKDEM